MCLCEIFENVLFVVTLQKVTLRHMKGNTKTKQELHCHHRFVSCAAMFSCVKNVALLMVVVTLSPSQSNFYSKKKPSAAPGFQGLPSCYRNFSRRELESLRIWWGFCIMRSLTSCTADSWSNLMTTYLHSWSWAAVWPDLCHADEAKCQSRQIFTETVFTLPVKNFSRWNM